MQSNHVKRIRLLYNHLYPNHHSSLNVASSSTDNNNSNDDDSMMSSSTSTSHKPYRTLHTGIINDPDSANFERKSPLRLDLRNYRQNENNENSPYTSLLLLDHLFHTSKLLHSRHIHMKYVEASGDCYIMFRTEYGLVTYSTIHNKHWIKYLMMHATGQEDPERAGEGEFRLEVLSDRDGAMGFTVNIVYIQGGVKLTISPIN